ncbi:hypothetical protein FSI36_021075, partial [Escherichia coli]|nr:hypothetical protein [Escherichia coli]
RPLNKTKGCLIANFATVPFDATKVHSSGFVAPYTLSQGLDRTLQYEFVHAKKDDITFVSE